MTSRRRVVLLTLCSGVAAGWAGRAAWSDSGPAPADRRAQELQVAASRADVCSPRNPSGVGLQGEYFADEGCRGAPLLTRIDPVVDFDAAFDWPLERAGERPRSVRWSGWVKPPVSGRYRFHVAGNASARVEVARVNVADAGEPAAVVLDAGRFVPVRIELDSLSRAQARVAFEWTAPHGARYVVPRALLHLPTETVQRS